MHGLFRLGLVCAMALGLVGLPSPSPARAGGPLIENFDSVVNHELMANCGDFKIFADGAARIASRLSSTAREILSGSHFTGSIKAR